MRLNRYLKQSSCQVHLNAGIPYIKLFLLSFLYYTSAVLFILTWQDHSTKIEYINIFGNGGRIYTSLGKTFTSQVSSFWTSSTKANSLVLCSIHDHLRAHHSVHWRSSGRRNLFINCIGQSCTGSSCVERFCTGQFYTNLSAHNIKAATTSADPDCHLEQQQRARLSQTLSLYNADEC